MGSVALNICTPEIEMSTKILSVPVVIHAFNKLAATLTTSSG
jgi:hypothetical protein